MFACADHPCTVLIADDVPDIRHMMRFWLDTGDNEFEVVGEAGDGAEAIQVAKTKKPHAVILDLSMPKMDGLQAIPEILKHSPQTKILVMSGFDRDLMSSQALQLGAHAYLEKGTSFTELTDTLRTLCPNDN